MSEEKKVGITFGCFDLLHPGHTLLLMEASSKCDVLIVGLHVDPSYQRPTKNAPVQSLFERWVQVRSWTPSVIPYQYEDEIEDIIKVIKPNVRFIGSDYIGKDFTGKKLCEDLGVEIHYVDRSHGFSTSDLRRRVAEAEAG